MRGKNKEGMGKGRKGKKGGEGVMEMRMHPVIWEPDTKTKTKTMLLRCIRSYRRPLLDSVVNTISASFTKEASRTLLAVSRGI